MGEKYSNILGLIGLIHVVLMKQIAEFKLSFINHTSMVDGRCSMGSCNDIDIDT